VIMGAQLDPKSSDRWTIELDALSARIHPYRLKLSEEQRAKIATYCTELLDWNKRYALLSRHDADAVLRKHVAACLGSVLLVAPRDGDKWVDVGTGAGLPGIVLKIMAPEQPITLIEGSHKKCVFLEHVTRVLGLGPMPILAKRVETLVARGEYLGEFDVLFARAVADIRDTLVQFGPLVRPGGKILTFKGPGWEDDALAAEAAGVLRKGQYQVREVLRVPWGPGHILLIQKESTAV
jgi:16S rRNA (guanine527-N7)-methyltransferase